MGKDDEPRVFETGQARLGGSVGTAASAAVARLLEPPFASLEWLRADLTGEKVTEFDDEWDHVWHRPFKNFSGDISGRFLEVMALTPAHNRPTQLVDQLVGEVLQFQRPDGSFSASGPIDWNQPIDGTADIYTARMMPVLWGNSRMLCGLVEAARAFGGNPLMHCARNLGSFYQRILPRFTDSGHGAEYTGSGTYAAGYATCYFPAMEGLVKLYQLCGEKQHLETAIKMAAFYSGFDRIPIDHSHGMLCGQVGLLLLHEATGNPEYLHRVEARWNELVDGGYINPAGGILEKCRPVFFRDEGCALVDWLRLNLGLARLTGQHRYWAMAERVLLNHLLQNQAENGGFGHRPIIKDESGMIGFAAEHEEAKWCCDFHGLLGFHILADHLCMVGPDEVKLPFALDFAATAGGLNIRSSSETSASAGELVRQRVSLDRPVRVAVRPRNWAESVTALDADGATVALTTQDGWLSTSTPVRDVTCIYHGGIRHEPRPGCRAGETARAFAYLGPVLLCQADNEEPAPLSVLARGRNVRFLQAVAPDRPIRPSIRKPQ